MNVKLIGLILLTFLSQTPSIDKLIQEFLSLKEAATIVTTAAELQAALDGPIVKIYVKPGEYIGNFRLKNKATRTEVIGIKYGGRAKPENVYPKLIALNKLAPVISTEVSASNYSFTGLEFYGVDKNRNVIEIGANHETTVEQLPHNITFDEVYIHGTNQFGHRGIFFDAVNGIVTNSHFSEFVEQGYDSNSIGIFNGAGPYLIDNNYFSASGEGMMVGGSDPTIPNQIPSDIIVSNNYFFKPLEWKLFKGSVKNAFELKNARRVQIFKNVFENTWVDAQPGSAVLFTVRNQNGKCPWCNITNIDFYCNTIKGTSNAAISILGTDSLQISGVAENISIRNNLIDGGARGILVTAGTRILEIRNNVFLGLTEAFMAFSGTPVFGLLVSGNSIVPGQYGISGSGTGQGTAALEAFAAGYYFKENLIERNLIRNVAYPAGNTSVPTGTFTVADWKCN